MAYVQLEEESSPANGAGQEHDHLHADSLTVVLRAHTSYAAARPTELSIEVGDVITYLPGRAATASGFGLGILGDQEGEFPLRHTQVVGSHALDAPFAEPLSIEPSVAETSQPSRLSRKTLYQRLLPGGQLSPRRLIWLLFSDPSSCILAKVISAWVMVLISVSTLAFVLETLPRFHVAGGPQLIDEAIWNQVETAIVLQFSAEYLVRLCSCPSRLSFLVDPMNTVDLVAIAPWYLETFGLFDNAALFRIFRLARVLRLFKLGKYASGLQMFARTLAASVDALALLIFFLSITVILFSSIIYYAERGEWSTEQQQWLARDGSPSQFTSIPAAFWWCIVTLTTVGYGDVVPQSLPGKLIAICTMLAGVITIALPISILGSNFQVEYDKQQKESRRKVAAGDPHLQTVLLSPLQQELSKLGELIDEMDVLTRVAQEKQTTLMRISHSPLFQERASAGQRSSAAASERSSNDALREQLRCSSSRRSADQSLKSSISGVLGRPSAS